AQPTAKRSHSPMEGRGQDRQDVSPVDRALRQAGVRPPPFFAPCWVAAPAVGDGVLVLESLLSVGSAAALFAIRLALVLAAIATCRAHREAPWIVGMVIALCAALG